MLGAAKVEVVGDQRLKERPGLAGSTEHHGPGHLDLAHRQLPPVPGRPVSGSQRQRQPRRPPAGARLDVAGPEPVADRLQRGRITAGGEPAGSSVKPTPALAAARLERS